jgi:hypothetical protein
MRIAVVERGAGAPRVNAKKSIEMMKCEMPFRNSTGSMTADSAFDDQGFTYIVKSYGVDIAKVRHEEEKDEFGRVRGYKREVWITDQKYSVTTSKHTTYARRALVI